MAKKNGVFNDDDAEAVKGLDTLGGGRIYELGRTYDHTRDQTMRMLRERDNQRGRG